MKSNDFATVNEAEGLGGAILGTLGNYALNKMRGVESTEERNFLNGFVRELKRQYKNNPNVNLDDFLELYFGKNYIELSQVPLSYKKPIDDAKQLVISKPNDQNMFNLGKTIFNIARLLPKNANKQQYGYSQQSPTRGIDGVIEPDTTQIINKIRSMKNTPEEIDDLLNIVAITMMKLYKIAPKDYKRLISTLFNNGGRPNIAGAAEVVSQPAVANPTTTSTPVVNQTPTPTTPSAPSTPSMSSRLQNIQNKLGNP